jgi:BirA family biotin operon repressor/biotin-[acetyl-CoA-carboxylase] ligase
MVKYIHVDRCDSTQDLLKEQLSLSPADVFTVSCEHQNRGRGRGQNVWEDSAGTLCFSMNVLPHPRITFTALELSLLVCRFFEVEGNSLKLKWPNDLYTRHGKKCGGILVQSHQKDYLAGIGINLFYEGLDYGGVYDSSFELDKKSWIRELSSFIRDHRYLDTTDLINDWQLRCMHLNEQVIISEGDTQTSGIFLGLGEHGEALVETQTGIERLYNGSLRLV